MDKDNLQTPMPLIEHELRHYRELLHGKTVILNTGDAPLPTSTSPDQEPAFWRYFSLNYDQLGLSGLIAVSYSDDPLRTPAFAVFAHDDSPRRDDGSFDTSQLEYKELAGDGSFASPECLRMLREADVAVGFPPFSSFVEWAGKMVDNRLDFIGIGPAITAREASVRGKASLADLIGLGKFGPGVNEGTCDEKSSSGKAGQDGKTRFAGKRKMELLDDGNGVQVASSWYTSFDIAGKYAKVYEAKLASGIYPNGDEGCSINGIDVSEMTARGFIQADEHVMLDGGLYVRPFVVEDPDDIPQSCDTAFLVPIELAGDARFLARFDVIGRDVTLNEDHPGQSFSVDDEALTNRMVVRPRHMQVEEGFNEEEGAGGDIESGVARGVA